MTATAPEIDDGIADLSAVERAVSQRRSVRGFTDAPVAMDLVKRLLTLAARAPSGTNMQPWKVEVLTGAALQRLKTGVETAFRDPKVKPDAEFPYYPNEFFEPYKSRRRKVGWDLYGLVGIEKGDTVRMQDQTARNFRFFDAPVGLIFLIDRKLEIGSWLDYGMFLQNIMVLARDHGLETCPQVAFSHWHAAIRQAIDISDDMIVVCGMSLGYADWARPENTLITERAPLDDFVNFHDG